jgi:hypothetical protein
MGSSADVDKVIRLALIIGQATMFAYAVFWGFNIRAALSVRPYRNQALGIGLIGLAFTFVTIISNVTDFVYSNNSNLAGDLVLPVYYLGFIVIFYWIDASALAARRSDPLLRDTLHWTRVRLLFWPVILILAGIAMSIDLYSIVTGLPPPAYLGPLPGANFLVILASGVAVLPISAGRSRDLAFRRHLEWFGVFAALLFAFIVESAVTNLPAIADLTVFTTLEVAVPFTAGAYCLYRSARSLVPLNRFSAIGPAPISSADSSMT